MNGYQNGPMMGDYEGPSSTSSEANSVFVTNLQWWTTDVELESACSQYGPVVNIRFIEDRACGKSRGMAVVEFTNPQAAQACIEHMSGSDINGRPCKVQKQMQKQFPGGPQSQGMGGGRGGMMQGRGRGGRGGMGGRGGGPQDGGMMMMGGPPGGMDPSMMGMPPPFMQMGGPGMHPQMMMGGGGPPGGYKPPPPPGAPH